MGKGADRRGFCGYDNVHEWREATFGDVRNTWNPSRKGGFAGYANVDDWRKATFGSDTSPATGPCGPSHPSTDAHTRYEHVAPEIPSGRIKPLSLIEKIASSENETISYLGKLNNMSFGRAAIVSEFTNDATRDRLPALEKLFTPERMIDLAQACQIKDLDMICWFPVAIETLRNDSWRQNPGRHERYEDLGSGRAEGCDIYFERRVVACAVPVQIAARVQELLQEAVASKRDFFESREHANNYDQVRNGARRKKNYELIQNLIPGSFVTGEELGRIATSTELETKELQIPLERFGRHGYDPLSGISVMPLNFFGQRSFNDQEMFDQSIDYRISTGMVLDGIRRLANLPGPGVPGLVWLGAWTSLGMFRDHSHD